MCQVVMRRSNPSQPRRYHCGPGGSQNHHSHQAVARLFFLSDVNGEICVTNEAALTIPLLECYSSKPGKKKKTEYLKKFQNLIIPEMPRFHFFKHHSSCQDPGGSQPENKSIKIFHTKIKETLELFGKYF